MRPRSLGYATDLAVLALEGARIDRRDDATVVSMPGNPAFRWGNFLLVPEAGRPEQRAAEHAARLPGLDFVSIGVDSPDPVVDEAAWRSAGFAVQRNAVLTAGALAPPLEGHAVREAREDDWAAIAAITLEGSADEADRAFTAQRTREARAAVGTGRAAWLCVAAEGRPVAALGIVDAGGGTARFQDVGTLEAHRRRGHAGVLLRAAADLAVRRWGAARLVIVAEHGGDAIRLYRRLGFREEEAQVQLDRVGPAVGAPA